VLGRRKDRQFQELEEYRSLLTAPGTYEEAFNAKTILGALFISIVMVPGNMYLTLMIGGGIGAAAEWVTIILFIEIAKRSYTTLRRQEVYLLLYVATALIGAETGAFEGLLWNQYFVQSPAAQQFGIAKYIPWWVCPQADSEAIISRTFFHRDWLIPIILLVVGTAIGKVTWFTGSYVLYRLTSDYERLPFPFAPISAQGAMALAEDSQGEEGWRWRTFTIGSVIGMAFGAIYVAVPAVTGALFAEPIKLIPIPWVDFTQYTGYILPATPLGFTAHLGPIFAGLVAPFWGIVGAFIGVIVHTIANPILHHYGYLPHWFVGMDTIQTVFVNRIDFWMSFGIGITLALTVIGLYQIATGVSTQPRDQRGKRTLTPPPGRGDFPIWLCIVLFALCTFYPIVLAKIFFPVLVGKFLIGLFLFFAFVYTPILSLINARLIGMVGMTVSIPYIREAIIFLSGFRGVEIWFVPFGIGDYSGSVQKFREIELTGTKFTSFVKAEIFMVPLVLATSFMYWSYIWKLAPIPSEAYPYVQLMWPLRALERSVWLSSTMRGELKEQDDTMSWSPGHVQDGKWYYWRARIREEVGEEQYQYGPWSRTGYFYTSWKEPPPAYEPTLKLWGEGTDEARQSTEEAFRLKLTSPPDSIRVDTPTPDLIVERLAVAAERTVSYEFEVDQAPTFDSVFLQTSEDRPILFEAIKFKVIGSGFLVGIVFFFVLSTLGLPILLVFGYVRSLTGIPHMMITEILGALLARYYFWKKYGRQQWRLYATILTVGFAVGMSLMGMASVAIAMIQKSVDVLLF